MKVFAFDPADYREQYAARGYVHILQGIDPDFHSVLREFATREFETHVVEGRAIGGRKSQALYEFPQETDYRRDVLDVVAALCGLNQATMTLSERHIKAYHSDAPPEPPPHKDRYASQASVGLSIEVPEGSELVLYPDDETDINPYNVSAAYSTSLPPHRRPEVSLKGAREVVLRDKPGDVMVFPGNAMWHVRRRPARAVNLYLKVNDFNCDPLGEDPTTDERRRATLDALAGADGRVDRLVPVLSRRLDTTSREYTRDWHETVQARLWDEGPVILDEPEFELLRSIDGRRTVAELANGAQQATLLRLAERGVVDLVSSG
jgi:hypothetical protein